jgi:hypothetical protein
MPARADNIPPDLALAEHSLHAADSFRLTIRTGETTMTVEVQRPDRDRIDMNQRQQIIRVGNLVWLRVLDGPWRLISRTGAGQIAGFGNVSIPSGAIVTERRDDWDGVDMAHVYDVQNPSTGERLRWYVRLSDGLAHKVVSANKKGTPMDVTIDDYDRVPQITPPST